MCVPFLVWKRGSCGPEPQVFWPLTPVLSPHRCTWASSHTGEGSRGAAPVLLTLPLGCWDSQGSLNQNRLIPGDSFGPDSTTEFREEMVETYVWPRGCLQAMLISACDDRWPQQGVLEGTLPHTTLPKDRQTDTHTHTGGGYARCTGACERTGAESSICKPRVRKLERIF